MQQWQEMLINEKRGFCNNNYTSTSSTTDKKFETNQTQPQSRSWKIDNCKGNAVGHHHHHHHDSSHSTIFKKDKACEEVHSLRMKPELNDDDDVRFL
jgi:hypothetical protein